MVVKVVNPKWLIEKKCNQLKWWTLCAPVVKLNEEHRIATRARAPARPFVRAVPCRAVLRSVARFGFAPCNVTSAVLM